VDRSRLVALATEAFATVGYAGMRMESVAARVGLTKASLFHHFSSKRELYVEALGDIVNDLRQLVQVRQATGDFLTRLDRLGELIIDYLAAKPLAARLLVRELIDDGSYLQGAGAAAVHGTLEATRAFLAAGMDAGAFRRQDPRQLAMTIVGLHLFYFAASSVGGEFLGGAIFTPRRLRQRKTALRDHVRALCLEPGRA
jgi:TetR/AcrR family transcriptional regulator